jgi:uncharacterized damage-inducible protein DinB
MTSTAIIRPAFVRWPDHNRRLRDHVATMTAEQLAIQPAPERWPLWATIGHLACQRVFWLCDFAGEPGAAESPFPNAATHCPGDDDLERVWTADELVAALDATFAIVERCLDSWTLESLSEEIRHPEWGPGWVHTRGWVLQGALTHDTWHTAEVNDALGVAGLRQIHFWD